MRERDEAQMCGEEVGGGGRWRGRGELRGEGGVAKQEGRDHEKKGERCYPMKMAQCNLVSGERLCGHRFGRAMDWVDQFCRNF